MRKEEVYRTPVAKKLKKLREERGFKPKDVAQGAGIKYDTYRYYETSVVPPSTNLIKIAKFLNVPLDYFTDREEEPPKNDYDSESLVVRNKEPYQPIKDDLGNLSETEILAIKIIRSLEEESRLDVLKYLRDKEKQAAK